MSYDYYHADGWLAPGPTTEGQAALSAALIVPAATSPVLAAWLAGGWTDDPGGLATALASVEAPEDAAIRRSLDHLRATAERASEALVLTDGVDLLEEEAV